VVIDCTAVQMATALAAIDGRAAAMSFQADPETGQELTVGQRRVAAFLVEVLRRLDTAGVQVLDVALRRPTLDDVFLSLTGHATASDELETSAS
jgi:ABC-2 type transport system ATP-binding protein